MESKTVDTLNVIMIQVGNEKYLFEIKDITEIYIPKNEIIHIPLSEKYLVGIIEIRNEIYTIISLKHKISEVKETQVDIDGLPILLLKFEGINIGLLVDSVIGVRELPVSLFGEKDAIIETDIDWNYIKSIAVLNDETYILLDLESLITSMNVAGENTEPMIPELVPNVPEYRPEVKSRAESGKSKSKQRASPPEKSKPTSSSSRKKETSRKVQKVVTKLEQDARELQQIKLSEIQKDALREIGNIGAGNAANALAKMINQRVDINIPSVEMLEINEFSKRLTKKNEKMFISWSHVTGKTRATVLVFFRIQDFLTLVTILLGDSEKIAPKSIKSTGDIPELHLSAMSEVGNILGSHYTSAIGNLLGFMLMTEPPDINIETPKRLFHILKDEIKLLQDLSLVITTKVIIKEKEIEGFFLFIPDTETLEVLLEELARFYEEE